VIADPSHAAGRRDMVPALARIAVAAGADGLLVEVHPAPEEAWSDGEQSLDFAEFEAMMAALRPWMKLRSLELEPRETGIEAPGIEAMGVMGEAIRSALRARCTARSAASHLRFRA